MEGPATCFLEVIFVVLAVRRGLVGGALDPGIVGFVCPVFTVGAEEDVPAGLEIR